MCIYGMNNKNPVDIFNCYRTAIVEDGLTEEDLIENKNINQTLEEKTFFLKEKNFYKRVMKSGGIIISGDEITECGKCFYNGVGECGCELKI